MAKSVHRVANLDRWKAHHGLRSSSAASPHTPKPRKGTRSSQRRRAIRDFD